MWVKSVPNLKQRDPRTKAQVGPDDVLAVDETDLTFARLIADGDFIACAEDGSPLPEPAADPAESTARPGKAKAAAPVDPAAPDAAAAE